MGRWHFIKPGGELNKWQEENLSGPHIKLNKLKKVSEVLGELENYKPLTLRQIYYQLVGKEFIENKVSEYIMLSKLIKYARIEGYVGWEDIEDRVRVYHDLTGWFDSDRFVYASLHSFLKNYQRDLMQTQDKYLEIWIEKDALSSLFTKVAKSYTIPVVVCRGFSSISFLHDFKTRLKYQTEKEVIMLYFGDFDPSGIEMLESMKITLLEEMKIESIEFKRIALLENDIEKYKLPHNPNALKRTDTRANKHLERYGELAVELDALRPDILELRIKESIESEINIDNFNNEIEKQKDDLYKLKQLKKKIMNYWNK